MAEPFLGEIRAFAFNWPPKGWAKCEGQTLPINQNQSLYSLLGTTFGGDGRTTFGLPDLRGRAIMHEGPYYPQGMKQGVEHVTLNEAQLPAHSHTLTCSATPAESGNPESALPAQSTDTRFGSATDLASMNAGSLTETGGGGPHENMQPYLVINYCISLAGLFPSRS